MFKTRLLSGIVLVVLALFFIISGGTVLLVSTAVISLIGMYEFYRVFSIEKKALGILGYLVAIAFYANLYFGILEDSMALVMAALIILLAWYVFSYPKYHAKEVFVAFFAIFYVAVMLSCVYQVRILPMGAYIVWLIFLCSWGCDTCAYCVGVLIGKHKMAPVLSPKKSIEGAVGGVLGSMILAACYLLVFRTQMSITTTQVVLLVAIDGIGAFVSMVGDLAASGIKRNYEIKDYGTLIPGHGGILDRFDSVIFTAPIIYYFADIMMKSYK